MSAFLIFPHQLFKDISVLKNFDAVYLIEEELFFTQYLFHKSKLVLHRASMRAYEVYLKENGIQVNYIENVTQAKNASQYFKAIKKLHERITYYDVCDNWLQKKINTQCIENSLGANILDTPLFVNTAQQIEDYFKDKKKFFQTDFYIAQRKQNNILVTATMQPLNGKWSFDADNRKPFPKGAIAPQLPVLKKHTYYLEAVNYVSQNFANNYGNVNDVVYPTTHQEALDWLNHFLHNRFANFGTYEDAIVANENTLHHSVLTPLLNIGLLTPMQIIEHAIAFGEKNNIAYNNVEGFVRQILGWREFIRGVYLNKGTFQRNGNYWQCITEMPKQFYNGTTGIAPVDDAIQKVLKTGYNHHIERLMVLSNFMLLCQIKPNSVYQWFMEMYIDAYDWVMVPNVYGMGQFADGGLMSTKPYISGSNYILKMSNYKKGEPWCAIWDALFWRFMHTHRNFFLSNPRIGMLVHTFDKMDEAKRKNYLQTAEKYLQQL